MSAVCIYCSTNSSDLMEKTGVNVNVKSLLSPWLVRHCAWSLTRLAMGADGQTAFKRQRSKDYVGELICYRIPIQIQTKMEPRWDADGVFRCHHQWVQHLDSELSLDLRAHRSAIVVFRLLILLLKTLFGVAQAVDFFRLHFSVEVEIESILFKIDWNKITHSILVQQFPKMISCSLHQKILVVLCT